MAASSVFGILNAPLDLIKHDFLAELIGDEKEYKIPGHN